MPFLSFPVAFNCAFQFMDSLTLMEMEMDVHCNRSNHSSYHIIDTLLSTSSTDHLVVYNRTAIYYSSYVFIVANVCPQLVLTVISIVPFAKVYSKTKCSFRDFLIDDRSIKGSLLQPYSSVLSPIPHLECYHYPTTTTTDKQCL